MLAVAPERSIKIGSREIIALWSDAAGTKGLGPFYPDEHSQSNPHPKPGAAFSLSLPRHLARMNEHINTKEMRAVEQGLLH